MLKTITKSSNKKLGGCAATYRSGIDNVYSTCPNSCPLKPVTHEGSQNINPSYLQALKEAVPQDGVSWTYTHFPKQEELRTTPQQTTINISTDNAQQALESFQEGFPTVIVVPSTQTNKVDLVEDLRFVRCPAEYNKDITCFNCGGFTGKPLCARQDRDYVIKFTAHGSQAKKIDIRNLETDQVSGGCYGNGGPVRLQWEKTKGSTWGDAELLTTFVSSLPAGSKLRHHVVGDIG
jgi:hypothetical protein